MESIMQFDAVSSALVLIDLQNSNVARQLAPHASAGVVRNSLELADALRKKGGTIVFVRVLVSELLAFEVDAPFPRPAQPPPSSASELSSEIQPQEGDVVITKRQWGAFYGTQLDQILRRRGIRTIVLGGIATNFGVESTARAAMDLGYELIFAEDAMSSISEEMHRFSVENLFPRIGRVRNTQEIIGLCR
jgi:nicotinamidase-related amidase